jgi:hypothetical protein
MKYLVIRDWINEAVAQDYTLPELPEGASYPVKMELIESADLGELFLEFTPSVLVPGETWKKSLYKYENETVVDKSDDAKKEMYTDYITLLTEKISLHLIHLDLEEISTHRKKMLYLKDPENPDYAAYLTKFNNMNSEINSFLTNYQTELDSIKTLCGIT